jgi:hypothetical protein
MHDLLFADKTKRSDDDFKGYAKQLGLDPVKFERDYADPATAQRVKDDMAECTKMEVRGAPGFLINGRLMSGAQPFERFKAVFEEELERRLRGDPEEGAAKAGAKPAGAPVPTGAPAPAPVKPAGGARGPPGPGRPGQVMARGREPPAGYAAPTGGDYAAVRRSLVLREIPRYVEMFR